MDQTEEVKTVTEEDVAHEITPTEGDVSQPTEYEAQPFKLDGNEVKSRKDIDLAFIKVKKDADAREQQLQAEIEELKRKQQEAQPAATIMPEPVLPDKYDVTEAEFNAAVQKRDQVIQHNALVKYQKDQEAKAQQKYQTDLQALEQARLAKIGQQYDNRTIELGIQMNDAIQHANTVKTSGAPHEFLEEIVSDGTDGPLVMKYLHDNQLDLYKLNAMTPAQRGAYIATQVKPKLKIEPPQNVNVPPPLDNPPQSGGAPSTRELPDPLLEGATFKTYRS